MTEPKNACICRDPAIGSEEDCPLHGTPQSVTVTTSGTHTVCTCLSVPNSLWCPAHGAIYGNNAPPETCERLPYQDAKEPNPPPADIEKLIEDLLDSYLRGHDCECETGRCAHVAKHVAAREALRDGVRKLVAETVREKDNALNAVNAIRNSIIGLQTINWSEHIYPLVAILNKAGYAGEDYPAARENVGTLLERAVKAESELETLRSGKLAVPEAEFRSLETACGGYRSSLLSAHLDSLLSRLSIGKTT